VTPVAVVRGKPFAVGDLLADFLAAGAVVWRSRYCGHHTDGAEL
jgi:hypothetical protein